MTEKLFYRIFNKKEKVTDKNIKILTEELNSLFNVLKEKNDIDNLKVLNNKIESIVKNKKDKLEKKYKKELIEITENIEDFIKEAHKKEKEKLIDVVKEVEKKYKKCENISEEKKENYTQTCRKTSTIEYEKDLARLQLELVKLQKYITESGEKLLIIFE